MTAAGVDRCAATVVVPTRDRAQHLARSLDAVVASVATVEGDVEVIVVDSASTDAAAIRAVTAPLGVTLLRDEHGGASRARNIGLDAARGEIVVFVDDDVVPELPWLRALLGPFSDPAVVASCNPIDLDVEGSRPSWLRGRVVESWYGALDFGDRDRRLDRDEYAWSASLAVRRDVARREARFDEALGRGTRYSNEDLVVVDQLHERGEIAYASGARVHHQIGRDRARRRWLLRRAVEQGRSDAAMLRLHPECAVARAHGERRPSAVRLVTRGWRSVLRRRRQRPGESVVLLDLVRRAAGMGFLLERRAGST